MSEYIKREDALHELSASDFLKDVPEVDRGITRARARCVLNAIPAADVEPVVRGEWVEYDLRGWGLFKCTNCGEAMSGYPKYKYCHECGAKMGAHGKEQER